MIWLTLLITTAFAAEPWTADVQSTDADLAASVWDHTPMAARNGQPAFVGTVPAGAGPAIMDRLVSAKDPTSVRVALVRWLRRSDADVAPWIATWLPRESEPEVRVALVHALRKLDGPNVEPALAAALTDADASVRAAAVVAIGYNDHADLVPQLVQATRDPSTDVAGLAARSLGWLGVSQAFTPVVALLDSPDPGVRLYAVRALERMDARRAGELPKMRALTSDPDPKLSRAARQLTGAQPLR